jgi:hypothetical protein
MTSLLESAACGRVAGESIANLMPALLLGDRAFHT